MGDETLIGLLRVNTPTECVSCTFPVLMYSVKEELSRKCEQHSMMHLDFKVLSTVVLKFIISSVTLLCFVILNWLIPQQTEFCYKNVLQIFSVGSGNVKNVQFS